MVFKHARKVFLSISVDGWMAGNLKSVESKNKKNREPVKTEKKSSNILNYIKLLLDEIL